MIYFFLSLVQVLAKLCGCWMGHGEYTVQTSMTAFFGLLFLSSFAMRLLDGSAEAYGDGIGIDGTHLRFLD